TFGKAIEWRAKVCCKDAATAKELKRLQDETIAKAKADPSTPKPVLKNLASQRWSLDKSRIIGTGKINLDTVFKKEEEDGEAVADEKKNAPEKKHNEKREVADEKKAPERERNKKREVAGLKPGQAIDEKKIKVPTKSRFNPKNVNETAEWVIA